MNLFDSNVFLLSNSCRFFLIKCLSFSYFKYLRVMMIKKILNFFKNKIKNTKKENYKVYKDISSMVVSDASQNTLGRAGFSWENGVGGRFQRVQDQQ